MSESISDKIRIFIGVGLSLAVSAVSIVLSKDEINYIIKNDPIYLVSKKQQNYRNILILKKMNLIQLIIFHHTCLM